MDETAAERVPAEPAEVDPWALLTSELRGGCAWAAFGLAVTIGSWRMDRLQSQNINPYTVPGLLPGLLGVATMLLGAMLAWRSWRRGARFGGHAGTTLDAAHLRRLSLVLVLIVGFSVVLVGHGLPFWIASAIFVAATILLLQAPQRAGRGRGIGVRDVLFALAVGLGSGLTITYVFQELFLVRLP